MPVAGGQLQPYARGKRSTVPYSVILDRNGIVVYTSTSQYHWEKMANPIRRLAAQRKTM